MTVFPTRGTRRKNVQKEGSSRGVVGGGIEAGAKTNGHYRHVNYGKSILVQ